MNILPDTAKEDLKRGLRTRLIMTALILLSVSFLVGTVMLLPAYILTRDAMLAKSETLPSEEVTGQEILALPLEIQTKLQIFKPHLQEIPVVTLISSIIEHKPKEVILGAFSLIKDVNKESKVGTEISFSGTAESRSALVSFETLLSDSGQFSSVTLPVSSLTRERNLPFIMSAFIEDHE